MSDTLKSMSDSFKSVSMRGLQTALLDSRSPVDSIVLGSFAAKNNWEVSVDGKLQQCHGFAKPYDTPLCPYTKDFDWHSNGGFAVADREPITLLFQSIANDGTRRLFAGTKTRFLQLDEAAGTWTVIGSGFGQDGSQDLTQTRFYAAQLQDKIFLTNGFDDVQYHQLGSLTMQVIPDLATAGESGVPITKVNRILSWNGLLFLFNMMEGGVRLASRIRWSDLNNGLGFQVGLGSSVSEFQDLTYGQRILNAIAVSGSMWVASNTSWWKTNLSIDLNAPAVSLSAAEVYSDQRNESKALAYPNTLVSTGFSMYYASRDAIYELNPFLPEPERVSFIYAASKIIYDDVATVIDKSACQSFICEYWPDTRELHFSWPVVEAYETNPEINCETYVPGAPIASSGINRHTIVANLTYKTTDYRDYGSTALVNFRSDILVAGSCNQTVLFLGANGDDFCLKQFGVGYAREIFNPADPTYSMRGYVPLLRWIMPFDNFDKEKITKEFLLDASPESNTTAIFKLRIGTSDEAVDVNKNVNNCGVLWHALSSRTIKCHSTRSPTASVAQNTRPVNPFSWAFLFRSKFIYCELKITNADGSPATTGGVSISRFEVKVVAV